MAANKKKRQRHLAKERARKEQTGEVRWVLDEGTPAERNGRFSIRRPEMQKIPQENIHWEPLGIVVERAGQVLHANVIDETHPLRRVPSHDLRDVFRTTREEYARLLDHVVTKVYPWWGRVIFDCSCGRSYEGEFAEVNIDSHLRAYRMWLDAHPDEEVLIALGGESTWQDNPNAYH